MSDFLKRTASVINMTPRRVAAVTALEGNLCAPNSAPADGFIKTLMFLDDNGALRSGDSLVSALHRLGVVQADMDGREFRIEPHGLFANGVVSDKAKELLETLAKEGFSGEISYLANGFDQKAVLAPEGLRLFEDMPAFKAG